MRTIDEIRAARAARENDAELRWIRRKAAAYGLDPDVAVEWFAGRYEGRIPPLHPE